MSEIELNNVSKQFADTTAVKRADFTIHDGEFFILVGPSGCGKSTLLNMIVGLEDVSEGEVKVDGETVNDLDPKDRNMAMVFQSYAIYPHMSVRDNMAFPLKLAKLSKQEIETRVNKAAEILELNKFLDRKPAALSGGQRQRVAMGRAIVREPKVFLLDEPLSNLDAKLRVQMRTEIARLQRRLGTTTIYVTHDQTEAMTLGDRIAVMRNGEVLQIGTPRELYEQPNTLFVAGFIGSPAMNLLPARWRDKRVETPLGEIQLSTPIEPPQGGLIVGIRPEHLQLVDEQQTDGVSFEVKVEVVEWLGADLYLYFDISMAGFDAPALPRDLEIETDQQQHRVMAARVEPELGVKEGETVRLGVRADDLTLFAADSGDRLATGRED